MRTRETFKSLGFLSGHVAFLVGSLVLAALVGWLVEEFMRLVW